MYSKLYSVLITFPFEQLGLGLRKLSLSGTSGNIAAIIIYVLICLLPCLLFFRLKRSGKLLKTDFFLPVLTVLLFAVIYYMINPGLFHAGLPGTGKMLLGCTCYSVIFGYIVLRLLETYSLSDTRRLHVWLRTLLTVVIFLFFYAILAEFFFSFTISILNLRKVNSYSSTDMTMTYIFLVLQCITNALPYILAVFILFSSIRSLNALLHNVYSDASEAAIEKLTSLCTKSLVIAVLSSIGFNILQLIFHKILLQIKMIISIPVFSIAFVLAVLLTANYVRENQKLKQDNDLFI